MNYRYLLLFIFLALCLAYCRNKDTVEPATNPRPPRDCGQTEFNEIDDSLMKQFLFNQGSYWIFRDSVNNTMDSVFCYGPSTASDTYMLDPTSPGEGPCYLHYRYAKNALSMEAYQYTYYIQDKYMRLQSPFGVAAVFLCSCSSGALTGDSLFKFYPVFTLNGVSYSNVYRLHFQASFGNFRYGYFYMKAGLGIIKSVLYDGYSLPPKVHELIRCHIQ